MTTEDELAKMLADEITAFEGTPPWDHLDPGIVPVVRAFAALPGINTISSCEGHPDRDRDRAEWHIGWILSSADPAVSIIDAGPSAAGWLTTEWLMWHANDLTRAGIAVQRNLSVPPPFLNYPGQAMTFWVRGDLAGRNPMNPMEYLDTLRQTWSQCGYGDFPEDEDTTTAPKP